MTPFATAVIIFLCKIELSLIVVGRISFLLMLTIRSALLVADMIIVDYKTSIIFLTIIILKGRIFLIELLDYLFTLKD